MNRSVRALTDSDRGWVETVFRDHWGAEFVVSRGVCHYARALSGFVCIDEHGTRVGVATYRIDNQECELVSLNAFSKNAGIGTQLVEAVRQAARSSGCTRFWLITTNDNLDAIRFYQRRGFAMVAVHANALEISRRLKPSIPEIGQFGIPLRDEVEFEMRL